MRYGCVGTSILSPNVYLKLRLVRYYCQLVIEISVLHNLRILKRIKKRLPFILKGTEQIRWLFYAYCQVVNQQSLSLWHEFVRNHCHALILALWLMTSDELCGNFSSHHSVCSQSCTNTHLMLYSLFWKLSTCIFIVFDRTISSLGRIYLWTLPWSYTLFLHTVHM